MIITPGATGRLGGHGAMLAFSMLVAGSFSLGSLAAPHIDPGALTALRFALAALAIGLVLLVTGRLGALRAGGRAPWRHGVLGGLMAIYFVLMFEGLKTATPVSAAAVFTLTPPMAGLFGWFLLRQPTTPRMALALAVGGAGALWVIFRADLSRLAAFHVGRGEAIYFVGCVAHAVYAPMVRRLTRGEAPLVFAYYVMAAGGVILSVQSAPAILRTDWAHLPAIVWVTLAYVALAASAATAMLLQYAAMRLPAAKVMAYTYLVPSWVILWELTRRASAPPLLVLPGVAMTVAALWMLLKEDAPLATPAV